MQKALQIIDVQFDQGATVSHAVPLGNVAPVALIIPSTWSTGDITFQGADPRSGPAYPVAGYTATFLAVYDDTMTQVKLAAVPASRYISFKNSDTLLGVAYLKLVSSVAQNNSGGLVVQLVCREV